MNKLSLYIGLCIYVYVLLWASAQGLWPLAAIMATAPFLGRVWGSRVFWMMLPISLWNSGLFIPGAPGKLTLPQLFQYVFIGMSILQTMVLKRGVGPSREPRGQGYVIFLLCWVFLLMLFRGTGMRILGSAQFGGGVYMAIIGSLMFYLATANATSSVRTIRRSGLALGCLAVFPLLANAAFLLSHGRLWQPLVFFSAVGATLAEAEGASAGLSRLTFLAHASALIWVGCFIHQPTRPRHVLRYAIWTVAMLGAVLSGFRSVALTTGAFFATHVYFRTVRKVRFVTILATTGVVVYANCFFFAEKLPFAAQRVIADVPGITVDAGAKMHAAETVRWRRELWARAAEDLDRYWFFGRGTTFRASELYWAMRRRDSVLQFYVTGSFHQASLELIILYGLPVLLACFLFYATYLRRCVKQRNDWHNSSLHEWSLCLLTYALVQTAWAFLAGQSTDVLVQLPLYLAFHNIIRNTDIAERNAAEATIAEGSDELPEHPALSPNALINAPLN